MAIRNYTSETGEQLYLVYVNVRGKTNRTLRAQRRITNIQSLREAEREELRLIRECERELGEKESKGSTWGAVVDAFDAYIARPDRQLHVTTRRDYVATVNKHTRHWWSQQAAEIRKPDVRDLLMKLKADGYSVGHLKKMKVVMNQIFLFGIDNGLIKQIEQSPAYGIQLGREEEKKPEILTIAEIKTLLSEAKRLEHPWYPVWALALLTGMRNGELYALSWSDIDWDNKILVINKSFQAATKTIKGTKGGYWRTVPISEELMSLLKALRAKAGNREFVLPRSRNWTQGLQAKELRMFCIGLNLPSVRFHALRACFATQLIRIGVPPIQIQKICGWKDLKTMQRYIRMAAIEIEGATDCLKILPPADVAAKVVNLFTKTPEIN